MRCSSCGSENREGSNFCRLCSAPLTMSSADSDPGYIPSVPPPSTGSAPGGFYNPSSYQIPPQPPATVVGALACPRCGSTRILKGSIPVWAIVATIIGFLFVLCFSLLFLLIKEPHKCLNCGLEFKRTS